MTPRLHPLTGNNRFCGPAAMASVLGISTDHAARVIRGISGQRGIKGVSELHLWQALKALGCSLTYRNLRGEGAALESAAEWVQRHASLFAAKHVIIVFGQHYGTLLGDRYQCSLTRCVIPLTEIPKPLKLVEACFFVDELPQVAPIDTVARESRRNAQATPSCRLSE